MEPITAEEARYIASLWHPGQWSALYAFASSGHCDRDGLTIEINRIYRDAEEDARLALSPDDRDELDALAAYVAKAPDNGDWRG